ncbi:hypothetical protein MANES_10G000157v8 [Manihot esculenta]|uniref:Uncharacterized protein n=1 Tax=Manihot esculenta TaxID=3983 RepID=A0ACB7H1M7_MANES|nr:hypothetical protein MANES_10G000157v8 [Manihot esculenta]
MPIWILAPVAVRFPDRYTSRLLHEHDSLPQNLASSEPTLNFLLLNNQVIDSSNSNHILPCEIDSSNMSSTMTDRERVAEKYGLKILHVLAKGPVPYSGPSKGTNDINN